VVQRSEKVSQTDAVEGDVAKHASDRDVDSLSIDAMRLANILRDNIGLSKKKKRGGFYQIFDKFTGHKDLDKDQGSSKLYVSFGDGTYEQRGPAVQTPVEMTNDGPPQPLAWALATVHILDEP